MIYLIGLGGAGSRIVDGFYKKGLVGSLLSRISRRKGERFIGLVADTSEGIKRLSNIPGENRVLIGRSRAKGHGTGGDVKLGRKIMEEESGLVLNALRKTAAGKPEALFLIAGLGGGTGTGGCKKLAERLKNAYGVPVIGLFILPSRAEGTLYLRNASKAIAKAAESVDGALIFDGDVLTMRGEDVPSAHRIIDKAISRILGAMDKEMQDILQGSTSAVGFLRSSSEQVLAKDALGDMLKEHIYFKLNKKGAESAIMLVRGDVSRLCSKEVAGKWCKKRFGFEVEYVLRDVENAKDLQIVTIIRGIKDIKKGLNEIESGKEETRSGFEELLEDIKPVF